VTSGFPKTQDDNKGKEINDGTMIGAKLQGALEDFQRADFRECFEWQRDCWACCMKSQGDYFEGGKVG
jgi:hypothetical protein